MSHCLFRKEKLQEAHQLQLFKANQRLLLEWSVKQSSEMAEKGLPKKSRAEVDRLIVEHQDWKVRVVSRVRPQCGVLHSKPEKKQCRESGVR